MTEGIVIGFAIGFFVMMMLAPKQEKTKGYQRSTSEPPKVVTPKSSYVKYPNCRVGETVYVNYQNDKRVDVVEVLAINEAGIIGNIITDENATDVVPAFYSHKYVFRTYKKEGTENE